MLILLTDISPSQAKSKSHYYLKMYTDKKWKLLVICLAIFMFYSWINLRWKGWYDSELEPRCVVPDEELEDMRGMGRQVKTILDEHELSYVIGFGSLWGALRIGDILPWDIDIDILVIVDRHTNIPALIKVLMEEMKKDNMDVHYRDWIGIIQGYSPVYKSQLDISFWCDYYGTGTMHRCSGMETWFFFVHHRAKFAFPARLVAPPLPTLPFINQSWPVPREGIEIQKYHYAKDWWKIVKPKGCD